MTTDFEYVTDPILMDVFVPIPMDTRPPPRWAKTHFWNATIFELFFGSRPKRDGFSQFGDVLGLTFSDPYLLVSIRWARRITAASGPATKATKAFAAALWAEALTVATNTGTVTRSSAPSLIIAIFAGSMFAS